MKKLVSLLVAVSMVLTLAACGNSASSTPAPSSEPAGASEPANEPAEEVDVKAAWPTGDTRIIVPNAAGGVSDLTVRLFADYVTKQSGKNVIVVNETGGNNTVGFETVRTAAPDGTTLFSFHSSAILNWLGGKVNYSVMDESAYTFIDIFYQDAPGSRNVVVVSTDSPYETYDDLIEAARANPGTISVGDSFGSSANLAAGMLEQGAGVTFRHLDGPDTTSRITGIIGGQFDFVTLGYAQLKPYIESGDMRGLAMSGSNKLDPDIPLLTELGYPDITYTNYGFIAGPAGMDQATVDAIEAWCIEFCSDPEQVELMEALGVGCEPWNRADALVAYGEMAEDSKKVTEALGW